MIPELTISQLVLEGGSNFIVQSLYPHLIIQLCLQSGIVLYNHPAWACVKDTRLTGCKGGTEFEYQLGSILDELKAMRGRGSWFDLGAK